VSRPAWKILRVLGNLLDLPKFDYQSSEQVRDELKSRLEGARPPAPAAGAALQAAATDSVLDLPMYQIDPVLRRSGPLLRTLEGRSSMQLYGGAA
jgi:NADH-quinone oxidoreductase subunit G